MIIDLEAPDKGAGGDAPMQKFMLRRLGCFLFRGDFKTIAFKLDPEICVRKTGYGNRDPVIGFIQAFDIIRGVGLHFRQSRLIKQRKQAIKTDGVAVERGQIKMAHGISSVERHDGCPPQRGRTVGVQPHRPAQSRVRKRDLRFQESGSQKIYPASFRTGTIRQPLACLRQIKAAQLWTG